MATNTSFQLILENGSVKAALLAAAKADDAQLEKEGLALNAEQSLQVCQWTATKLRLLGVEQLIYVGGLMYLMLKTTGKEERRGLLLSIADDLGISETKAYDAMAVFRAFGAVLLESPELMGRYTMEPLKRLAGKQVTEEAREAAIELATSGQRITTSKAEALIAQFATEVDAPPVDPVAPPESASSQPPALEIVADDDSDEHHTGDTDTHRSGQTIWQYEGDVVRLILEAEGDEVVPYVSILHDLEAALDQYRRECVDVETDADTASAAAV